MAVVVQVDEQRKARLSVLSDDEGYAIAEDIRQQRPGWLVIFGCYSRQFVAFPLFAVDTRTILTAQYPDALIARMAGVDQQRQASAQQ